MPKRRLYLIVAVSVLVAALALVTREREPEYGGKKLSEWVMDYGKYSTGYSARMASSSPPQDADEAMRHIGTIAIPHLLKWLRYEPPTWRKDLANQLFRLAPTRGRDALIERIIRPTLEPDNQEIRANGASIALERLGSEADGAIPSLARLVNDTKAPASAWRAADLLMELHSLPSTLALLTNNSEKIRDAADLYLANWAEGGYSLGPDAFAAAPILNNLLEHTNASTAHEAAIMLMRLAAEGERPVPANPVVHAIGLCEHSLVGSTAYVLFFKLCENADPAIRIAASNACLTVEGL